MTSQPQDAVARLKYLKNCEIYRHIRPYTLACKVDEGFPLTNLVFETGPEEKINDIRGLNPEVTHIDTLGFCTIDHSFQVEDFDTDSVNNPGGYADQLQQVVKASLERQGVPVERMGVISWVYRSAAIEDSVNEDLSGQDSAPQSPAVYMHNDCNFKGAEKRVRAILGEETDSILLKKRVRIMNCWMPVKHAVEDCHLAVCDARSVAHDKCIHGQFIINTDYVSENIYVGYSPGQIWYYISNQRPGELLIFKQHDTEETSNSRYVPHGAFWLNDPRMCKVQRESIEVRLWVLSPK